MSTDSQAANGTAAAPASATTTTTTADAAVAQTSAYPVPQYRTLPYGEQQGTFWGVAVGSNRDDGFFSGENNYVNHLIFTGFRYQCVEYARRFLLLTTGCIFDECGRASEIYKKREITHVETGAKFPLIPHDNGTSTEKPKPGDIIIYPYDDKMCPWGHVGIISYVDDTKVGIAEQNQYFGSLVSPSPDYLNGERCVGRFIDLEHNAEKGSWLLKETDAMPSPLGWMSYPGTTRRELIYETFTPLPEYVATRATPMEDPRHPFLFHLRLPEPIELPSGGIVAHLYGLVRGSGESTVGAGTATSRVLRFVLQALFRRDHIGAAFLSLPTNPLHADIAPCPALDPLFGTLAGMGTRTGNETELVPALAAYFGVPERWVAAMQSEFAKGELHMFANVSYAMNAFVDDVEEDKRVEADLARESGGAVASGAGARGREDEGCSPKPTRIRVNNPHDEAWQLAKVNFGTTPLMVELPQLAAILPGIQADVEFQLPGYRCFGKPTYGYDFGNYLKMVEEQRGPRTAFTIVLDKPEKMDGPRREIVTTLQAYCEKIKYPVRVVSEEDLHYAKETGKLHVVVSEASPPVASPTSVAPLGDYEVNFVFALCEWEEVLRTAPEEHQALYDAATHHEKSDVVFAKPLWSYLINGLVHRAPRDAVSPNVGEPARHADQPHSIKFFDIVRRFYQYALPRQAAETWDQEVSEFKDSCRRLSLLSVMPTEPLAGFVGSAAIVNFAFSAMMAHVGGKLSQEPLEEQALQGQPAALMHVFSTEND